LAEHYAKPENRPELTYFFVAVAAEENNLLGATFYAENPVIPLDRTLQMFSIDMVADNASKLFLETGPEGQQNLDRFVQINKELQLFDTLVQDPLSNDSDHYPFAIRKVPALYIMVDGDAWSVYHTPLDDFDHVYTNQYLPLFRLITAFVDTF
jgi:Zn-dependent M28 family amino/carboxypeptidase